MKKLLLGLSGLAIILTTLLIVGCHPLETTPLAETLLPATTLAFVDIPDFQNCRARVAASPLAPFCQNPEIQACFGQPFADWTGTATTGQSPLWLTALLGGEALALPHGEAFVAITQMAISPDRLPQFTLAAGINLTGHKLATQASLKLFAYKLQKSNPAATVETRKHLGYSYTLWKVAPDSQVCQAFFGSLLVFTTDEDLLRDMLARYLGKAEADAPALTANAGYQNTLRQLAPQSDLHAYLNVEQLVTRFGLLLMAIAPNNSLVQQLANIQAWGTGITFGETNITDVGVTTYVHPNPPAPPIRLTTMAAAPTDSTFYFAGTPNLADAYNNLLEAIKLSGNHNAAALVAGLELATSFSGINPAKDLLARLGPEVAGIANWREGAQIPDLGIVAEVRDQPSFARKFDRLNNLLDKAFKTGDTLTLGGVTLRVIHTNYGSAAPTYALTDKFFILALTPDYARELVSQIQTSQVSLAANRENSDTQCDLRLTLAGLYSLAGTNTLPLLGPLPSPATIARYVGNYSATTVASPTSSMTTAHSPLGKPVTLALALVGGLAAAQSWLPELQAAIPALPKMSSGTPAPLRPAGNQMGESHNQSSQ